MIQYCTNISENKYLTTLKEVIDVQDEIVHIISYIEKDIYNRFIQINVNFLFYRIYISITCTVYTQYTYSKSNTT